MTDQKTGYNAPDHKTEYRGFQIMKKQDFGNSGYLIEGHMVTHGYIVIQNSASIMPGGVWFLTVKDAKNAIDDFIKSQEDAHVNEHPFHKHGRFRRSVNNHSLELYDAIINHLEETYDATGGASSQLRKVLAVIRDDCDMRDRVNGQPRGEFDPQLARILRETMSED